MRQPMIPKTNSHCRLRWAMILAAALAAAPMPNAFGQRPFASSVDSPTLADRLMRGGILGKMRGAGEESPSPTRGNSAAPVRSLPPVRSAAEMRGYDGPSRETPQAYRSTAGTNPADRLAYRPISHSPAVVSRRPAPVVSSAAGSETPSLQRRLEAMKSGDPAASSVAAMPLLPGGNLDNLPYRDESVPKSADAEPNVPETAVAETRISKTQVPKSTEEKPSPSTSDHPTPVAAQTKSPPGDPSGEPTPADPTDARMAPFARAPLEEREPTRRREASGEATPPEADEDDAGATNVASTDDYSEHLPSVLARRTRSPSSDTLPGNRPSQTTAKEPAAEPLVRSKTAPAANDDEPLKPSEAEELAVEPLPLEKGLSPTQAPPLARQATPNPSHRAGWERFTPRAVRAEEKPPVAARMPQETSPAAPSTSTVAYGDAPNIQVETVGARTVVVGKTAEFVVKARNTGTATADGVELTIRHPAWAEVVSVTAAEGETETVRDEEESKVLWRLDRLPAQSERRLRIGLVPRRSHAFSLGVTWSFAPAVARAEIEVLEPKLAMSVSGPNETRFGERKVYKITVTNPGTATAENVQVALLPLGGEGDPVASMQLGSLAPQGTQTLEIELTPRKVGETEICVRATAEGGIQADAAQKVVVRRAELELSASSPELKYAGTNVEITAAVRNVGDAVADNVVASLPLPRGAEFVTAEKSEGGGVSFDPRAGVVQWRLGDLATGEHRQIALTLTLQAEGEQEFIFTAKGPDDLLASAATITTVKAVADLKLVVNDPPGPAPVGEDAKYEIVVTNRGTKTAEHVELAVYFSEGIEPVSAEGPEYRLAAGQVAFEPIARIAAGETVRVTVMARAQAPGNHTCRTKLTCEAADTRLAVDEITRFYEGARTASQEDGASR